MTSRVWNQEPEYSAQLPERWQAEAFRPAWWLPGAHLQTLGARWLRGRSDVPFHTERIELPDGDFVDLDWAFERPESDGDGRPLVLLLHGLEGSARSGYALELYRQLRRRDVLSVGMNFRSCSSELNRLPRMYHSGDTGDLNHVLELLAARYPRRARGAVGVSLGGNALLKMLGESGSAARFQLRAATAISVPFDLSAGAEFLERPVGRLYTGFLIAKMRRKLVAKQAILPGEVDVSRALKARGFRQFDDAATAPLHGFQGADDYYRRSSSGPYLDSIRVPTLLIHSADDPFLPADRVPREVVEDNPYLHAAFTSSGGHIGFVAGSAPWRPVFWAEQEAARFLTANLRAETGVS